MEMAQLGDVHPDGFIMSVSSDAAHITFLLSVPHPEEDSVNESTPLVTVRLSLERAKILSMGLAEAIVRREKALGPVQISEEAQERFRQSFKEFEA